MPLKLNTTNGSITLTAEDGSGNVALTIPRAGYLTPTGDGSALTGIDALPTQTSQSGKILTTNGSAASWVTPTDTDTVYDSTAIDAAVALNTAKVTNVVHPLVEAAVPSNAVFTDTTYSIGDGGLTQVNFTTADNTKLDGIAASANNYSHPANHAISVTTGLQTALDAALPKAGGTLSGTIVAADNIIQSPVLKDYAETKVAMAGTDVDLALGNVQTKTISGAQTLTFSNPPASGSAGSFTLILTNGGSATVTWPTSVDWPLATAPTLTAAGVDVLFFTTVDGGTIWYGTAVVGMG